MLPDLANGSGRDIMSEGEAEAWRSGITIILRDLVACWLVLIEVVFTIKAAGALDVAVHCDGSSECGYQCCFLEFLYFLSVEQNGVLVQRRRTGCDPGNARSKTETWEFGAAFSDVAAPVAILALKHLRGIDVLTGEQLAIRVQLRMNLNTNRQLPLLLSRILLPPITALLLPFLRLGFIFQLFP